MRDRRFLLKSLQTAGLANLPRKICAPRRLPQPTPCCFDHGCTGRASGFTTPRLIYRPRGIFVITPREVPTGGQSPEPSSGGGPRVEAPEVLSVSTNIDLDHDDIMYPDVVPFLAIHVGCIAAIWSGVTWQAIVICVVLYWLRMFAITAGYHRYSRIEFTQQAGC